MEHKSVKYEGCGLPSVFLMNGFRTERTPYGPAISIVDVEGLHRAIGNALVDKPGVLSGPEFRFLRKLLDFSQKTCGELFGVDAQTIALWEKNNNVDKRADALLRTIVRQDDGADVKVRQLIDRINAEERHEKLYFRPRRNCVALPGSSRDAPTTSPSTGPIAGSTAPSSSGKHTTAPSASRSEACSESATSTCRTRWCGQRCASDMAARFR
jgi:putative transcriptional regulator